MLELLRDIRRSTGSAYRKMKFLEALRKAGKGPKIFYLMGLSEQFPNLGDQAQAAAIPLWIQKHFMRPLVEVKTEHINDLLPLLAEKITPQDFVFLHSGGNFGDDWYETQALREKVLSALPENCIVQLPQTVHYSATELGQLRLQQSKRVVGGHPRLMLFGRDRQSENLCRAYFPKVTIAARPDMVLSMQQRVLSDLGEKLGHRPEKISKVLLILRNDKEGVLDVEAKQRTSEHLTRSGYETQLWDTDVSDIFPEGYKYYTLRRYLDFIASFDAVVTDRYHGLIFSVLVQRPCVVLKTHNHKLTSAFDWFEGVNYTVRAEGDQEIVEALKWLEQVREYKTVDWNAIHFDPMAAEVKLFLGRQGVVY